MPLFGKAKKQEPAPEPFSAQPGGMPMPPEQAQQPYPNQPLDMQQQGYSPEEVYDQQAMGPMPPQMPMAPAEAGMDRERIEEVAEAIIDEKWNELLKDVNKMIEWKEKTEATITRIEQDIQNLKSNFESLHKGILGKISEYDQNLLNVGTEIKAMEKVFQKVLPTFTENVNKLSRLTKGPSVKPKPVIQKKK